MTCADFYQQDFRDFLGRFDAIADLIVTSPPYVDARTPEAYGLDKPWAAQDDRDLGEAMFAALRPGGTAIVVVGSPVRTWREGHATERGLEPWRWLIDLADRVGFTIRDHLIYGRLGQPGEYRGRFRNDWEPMFWLERPGGVSAFDKTPLDALTERYSGKGATMRQPNGDMRPRVMSGDAAEQGVRRRGTVWTYGTVGHGHNAPPDLEAADHPAPLPLRTAEDAVACFSQPGDLVLDPFLGRGTTALACKRLDRRFAGGDLGHDKTGRPWADVAREIVGRHAVPLDLFGEANTA
jgi:DNA modification methylase